MTSPTTPSPDSAELRKDLNKFLQNSDWGISIFAGHRDVLVNNLVEFITQQRQALLQQLEQALPEKQDTVAIAKQYGSGSPQDALALGKNVTIAKVHKILIKARENKL